jgi:hypothetical protein
MEARPVNGHFELVERLGENKDIVYALQIPLNFTWDVLHSVLEAMAIGAKEWQQIEEKRQADAKAAQEATEAEKPSEEVIA